MVKRYIEDPTTDYHTETRDRVLAVTGLDLQHELVKNINFGGVYGIGLDSMAILLNISYAEAKEILEGYHKSNPYIKSTFNYAASFILPPSK